MRVWANKISFDQKLKRKWFDKEEGKTYILFHENIRALGWL